MDKDKAWSGGGHDDTEANARLIVRAVNNHDSLVCALRDLIEEIETDGGVDTSEWPLLDRAKAALAAAGQEP